MDLLALLVAVVALLLAWSQGRRLIIIGQRLVDLERQLGDLRRASAAGAAPAAPAPAPATEAPAASDAPPVAAPDQTAAATPEAGPAAPARPSVPPMPTTAAAAPAGRGFEERFGTQWVVWIGGLALALGGLFLVRYSIEQGLLGPGVRVALGAVLAAALVGAGEWTRRHDRRGEAAAVSAAHIPSVLTAAGTTVAYATVYAAYALYGFLAPAAAFVLLGLVALATLAAALLHGPALAGLGLLGAYVTPLLVASEEPNFPALYVYLTVVTAAAFGLARLRLWRWLALTAVALATAWILPGLGEAVAGATAPHTIYVVMGFGLAALLIVAGLAFGPPAVSDTGDQTSGLALAGYLVAAALITMASGHDSVEVAGFALLVVGTVAAAWRAPAAIGAVPAAVGLVVLVMAEWAIDFYLASYLAAAGPVLGAVPEPARADYGLHLWFGGAAAVLFGAAGFLAQGRSQRAAVPLVWAACAVVAPLAILAALYYRIAGFDHSVPFAGLALLVAALFGTAAENLGRRPPRPGLALGGALFAVGTVAALALALAMALERGWLTVALALMVPGIAFVALQRPWPLLRWLAAAVSLLVLARVGWEPRIVGDAVGTTPIFNWLLYGYGLPAAAFWLAGHLLRQQRDDASARVVDSLAILFTALLVSLEIRHLVNDGDVYRRTCGLAETGLQVSAWLALAIGLERVRARTRSLVHNIGALVWAALALGGAVVLVFPVNPLLTGRPIGGAVINLVLLGYGLPALLTAVLAVVARASRPLIYRALAAAAGVGMAMLWLSLEIRRFFHGPVLTLGPTTDLEQYTYSAAWLAFGVVLLLAGVGLRSQPARLASAAVVCLTVAKVFLYDLAGLAGIFRALSFIGLGLVLVGIGLLYQRLLFPHPAATADPDAGASGPPVSTE